MYSSATLAFKYLNYYLTASNSKGHGMHSPFVFNFITTVLNDKEQYAVYGQVEQLRQQMLRDETVLTIEDFGAGSVISKSRQRSVSSIAKSAVKPVKYGQLLHRIIRKYKPGVIAELGTSLGITTCYLASACVPATKVVTFEGAQAVAGVAKQNFTTAGLNNIEQMHGNFDTEFPRWLATQQIVDFCFIDGNHRKEPTIAYFEELLQKAAPHSIFVFDDIHWSRDMEEAWELIREHPAVRCSIDLFFIGIVFFKEEFKEKQHFRIRF